jgi:hypothetical protein
MGRTPWTSRLTVEDCLYCLAVERLQHDGVFAFRTNWFTTFKGSNGETNAVLHYSVQEGRSGGLELLVHTLSEYAPPSSKAPGKYVIPITSTHPHLGGTRYWFCCPIFRDGKRCGRRVGRLYLPPGQQVFGCRPCYGLTYRSCQQHAKRKNLTVSTVHTLAKTLDTTIAQLFRGIT